MTTTYKGTNSGALFRNKYKHKETDPDYSGTLNIGGSEYSVLGWAKISRTGVKFMRLSTKPKRASIAPPNLSAGHPDDDFTF